MKVLSLLMALSTLCLVSACNNGGGDSNPANPADAFVQDAELKADDGSRYAVGCQKAGQPGQLQAVDDRLEAGMKAKTELKSLMFDGTVATLKREFVINVANSKVIRFTVKSSEDNMNGGQYNSTQNYSVRRKKMKDSRSENLVSMGYYNGFSNDAALQNFESGRPNCNLEPDQAPAPTGPAANSNSGTGTPNPGAPQTPPTPPAPAIPTLQTSTKLFSGTYKFSGGRVVKAFKIVTRSKGHLVCDGEDLGVGEKNEIQIVSNDIPAVTNMVPRCGGEPLLTSQEIVDSKLGKQALSDFFKLEMY